MNPREIFNRNKKKNSQDWSSQGDLPMRSIQAANQIMFVVCSGQKYV